MLALYCVFSSAGGSVLVMNASVEPVPLWLEPEGMVVVPSPPQAVRRTAKAHSITNAALARIFGPSVVASIWVQLGSPCSLLACRAGPPTGDELTIARPMPISAEASGNARKPPAKPR
jgi:hypothetical protein